MQFYAYETNAAGHPFIEVNIDDELWETRWTESVPMYQHFPHRMVHRLVVMYLSHISLPAWPGGRVSIPTALALHIVELIDAWDTHQLYRRHTGDQFLAVYLQQWYNAGLKVIHFRLGRNG